MGLKFVVSFLSPDLNIGTTSANFKIEGNTPASKDLLIYMDMGADKIRQARFNKLTDTESQSVPVNFKLEINNISLLPPAYKI